MHGELLKHTVLFTGSSGGMMGAAYLRDLNYLKAQGLIQNSFEEEHVQKIGSDLLNPIATSIALNDLFLRLQSFKDGDYQYPKDRGYAFEKQLNENTGYILDKRLIDYREPEAKADMPMMIFSPTILNDAKRLIISAQPVSFLSLSYPVVSGSGIPEIEDIEFTRLFEKQNAMNLRMTSAIRMNASFPYVLPNISLPSIPTLEVADAGMRDNYGIRTAIKYIFHLRRWIEQNTSGVVILRIHDSRRPNYKDVYGSTYLENLFSPVGGVLNNISRTHMHENDLLLQFASAWLHCDLNVVDFRLSDITRKREISVSLHLTSREKEYIREAVTDPNTVAAMKRVQELLR